MSRQYYRKTDPINVTYTKTSRIFTSDLGVFYKSRGGKVNGPFDTLEGAQEDLAVFMKILEIEEGIDTENLQLMS
ncbi:hypothetical protein [Aliikangiella sp. IMCC44359]|uniref:hypothetical protein n=1 Tax=Aliikangiella sp. IMCC44359 TaxID=3459125 RepID=UPI00403B2B6E